MRGATERRLAALGSVCDTYVPAVDAPAGARGQHPDFWARRASDIGVPRAVWEYIQTQLRQEDVQAIGQLLDLFAFTGFTRLPTVLRERELRALRRVPGDLRRGLDGLRLLILFHFYGMEVDGGPNPNWAVAGYPGPPDITAPPVERLQPLTPPSGSTSWQLEADVVVVGSGSGGGVIAAELAAAGRDVIVVEAGPYHDVDDFPTDEVVAWRDLYWRGGPNPSEDENISILAGSALGGGSTINWMVATRPKDSVLGEWATEHGLSGLDGAAFDEHYRAVARRVNVNPECSPLSSHNERLREGADALGWSWFCADRAADPERFDEATAGFMGLGDRSGARQGTLATFLRDAAGHGARMLVDTRADRVLTERGRAAGVEATYLGDRSGEVPVTIRAKDVVVAAGALETPAVLLRSGIGGPAVGHHLRIHPVATVFAYYTERQELWVGPPLTVIVDEFADRGDGYGFLLETPAVPMSLGGPYLPWWSGREHKILASKFGHVAAWIALVRDHGGGRVSLDEYGEAAIEYPLDDPVTAGSLWDGFAAMVRAHEAAGARTIVDVSQRRSFWRRGESLEGFLDAARGIPLGTGRGRVTSTAHQMGSARMGTDPRTSVADPEGQLHDTPGVWIGDTSAFPSALGTHPMLTCMALARRTAHALLADS
jgi:choline dehydrogenase-like flavoprotein